MHNNHRWPVLLVMGLLMIAALACSFSFSTANIKNARLAADEDGNNTSDVFASSDTVYAVFDLDNAPDDTRVKAIWTQVEVDGEEVNAELLKSEELETSSANVWFSLSNDAGLTVGKYKVDLYLNDEKEETLRFEVQ